MSKVTCQMFMLKFKSRKKKRYHEPDYIFIIALFSLIVFGLFILSSASAASGIEKFNDVYYFLKHQLLFGFIPGLFLFVILSFLDYRIWRKLAFVMLVVSIALLVSVFIPGVGADFGTAKSWIYIGGATFQPSELVKLTFLLYLAGWLESREKHIKNLNQGLAPFLFILGIIALLVILQPDIGTLSIIILMSIAVYYVAGAELKHLAIVGLAGIASLAVLIKIAPYRLARLTTFLHPELDPQGLGYHINQAFLAIGSGGVFGRGFGQSLQKFLYLPEVTGDSIFAVFAEEMGFIVATGLVILFVYLMYRAFKIAQKAPDRYSKLIVVGIVSWFIIQAFVNIGAMVGLMPLTGVPLPFISSGGSALMVAMAASGILVNISRQT